MLVKLTPGKRVRDTSFQYGGQVRRQKTFKQCFVNDVTLYFNPLFT